MRNAAGEQAELFQRLGFAPFALIALTFGDIAEDQNHAADFVSVRREIGEATCSMMRCGAVARSEGGVLRQCREESLRASLR